MTKEPNRILIVDDDLDLTSLLRARFSGLGHEVEVLETAEAAIERLEETTFDLILCTIELPGMSGLEFCEWMAKRWPPTKVLLMTARSCIDSAVRALRSGAGDYWPKPIDVDGLETRVSGLLRDQRQQRDVHRLQTGLREGTIRDGGFEGLIGTSAVMQRVYSLIDRAAQTDASVLITGESGTGKELVARALHMRSQRSEQRFVPVNCSAIPENLFESELFGHAKGAFTDARNARAGLFREASRGTLFLDELGETPSLVQPKLLRALEERRVRPVGGDAELPIDVRFIAATNVNLESAVSEGRFREDLFFRVNVIHLELPPLRHRGTDVLLLAQEFVSQYSRRFEKRVTSISTDAAQRLMAYRWPGNVRELRNTIERAVALCEGEEIQIGDLPLRVHGAETPWAGRSDSQRQTLAEVERRYIMHVLKSVEGNKSLAARRLGVDRKTLHRKLRRYEQASIARAS